MRVIRQLFLGSLAVILTINAYAGSAPHFKQDKDYTVINNTGNLVARKHDKITVYEFFNYGCPWCYQLDPYVEKWLKHKPSNVIFERIPVQFNEVWTLYAKAYYVANVLGIEKTLTPAIFSALHADQLPISTPADLERFFVPKYTTKQQFDNAFNFSPGIDQDMHQGQVLMRQYGIFSVPTIIVAAKYKTDNVMAKGSGQRLMNIIKFLIHKAK